MDRTTSPHYQDPNAPIQKTLALIRPEAMPFRDAITKRIWDAGFRVLCTRIVKLTHEQAVELYGGDDLTHATDGPLRVASLCCGPVQAMCLAKPQAIAELLALLGGESAAVSRERWPGSLRARFGGDGPIMNGIMGSADLQHARAEIGFFFPNVLVEPPMADRNDQWRYLNTHIYPTLMDGIHEMTKRRPTDAVVELALWLWENNPKKPMRSAIDFRVLHEIDELRQECSRLDPNSSDNDNGEGDGGQPMTGNGRSVLDVDRCPAVERHF